MNITRRMLALVALLAGLATALVIHAGTARTTAQKDALAALKHPETVTAVRRGETIVAIAPPTTTTSPAQNIAPPAQDSTTSPTVTPSPSPAPTVTTTATTTTATTPTDVGLPKVGYIFLVSLSTPTLKAAFRAGSSASYLHSLLTGGTLLTGYRSLGHGELADQLGLLSGQAPNPDTSAGCPRYAAFPDSATPNTAGLVSGRGCIYPDQALTLADQVTNDGKQWGAYVDGMGATPCPTPQTGGKEDSVIATADAAYDTIHNPFIFFQSLTGSGACYLDEGDPTTKLTPELAGSSKATPALTYLAPDACGDGALADSAGTPTTTSTTAAAAATTTTATVPGATVAVPGATASTTATATDPTATASTTTSATSTAESATTAGRDDLCPAGLASGISAEDTFLETWIPQILASKAYKANGVLIIAFTGTRHTKASTGALVISRWTPKAKRIATAYSPYSLLHSIEDMLDLQPLANAADAPAFAKRVL